MLEFTGDIDDYRKELEMNKKIEKMNEKIMVSYCMGCGKIRLPDGSWGVPELSLDSYVLSHSYCKPCGEQAIAEARAENVECEISALEGKILSRVEQIDNRFILFYAIDGSRYEMYHDQDCCEDVRVDEVIGDYEDLVGVPILDAREESSSTNGKKSDTSFMWTFYIIRTIKGTVTIRWYGSSNGYYSESVSFREFINESQMA